MSSKGSLPAATTWLLAISDTLQRYGIVVLSSAGGVQRTPIGCWANRAGTAVV